MTIQDIKAKFGAYQIQSKDYNLLAGADFTLFGHHKFTPLQSRIIASAVVEYAKAWNTVQGASWVSYRGFYARVASEAGHVLTIATMQVSGAGTPHCTSVDNEYKMTMLSEHELMNLTNNAVNKLVA